MSTRARFVKVLAFLAASSAGLLVFRHFTKPDPWSAERDITGGIYSAATGTLPDDREIVVVGGFHSDPTDGLTRLVCCHEASSGRILWETRETGYDDRVGLQVAVAIDAKGCVFVASHDRVADRSATATLIKLRGSDGISQWQKQFSVADKSTNDGFTPPVIDSTGNVWLIESFQRAGSDGFPSRQSRLRLLDGRDGSCIGEHDLDKSKGRERLPEVESLRGGGALVFVFDETAVRVFRFTSVGMPLGDFSASHARVTDYSNLYRHVDEERRRVLISHESWSDFFYPSGGNCNLETTAFSFENGEQLWRSKVSIPQNRSRRDGYLPQLAVLRPDGDLEHRDQQPFIEERIDWQSWRKVHGIPLPGRRRQELMRLERRVLSGKDGSIGSMEVVSSWGHWFEVQEAEAGTATKEIRRRGWLDPDTGGYRCMDARRWLPESKILMPGDFRQRFRALKTPSGRTILVRDATDRMWRERVENWQIRGM